MSGRGGEVSGCSPQHNSISRHDFALSCPGLVIAPPEHIALITYKTPFAVESHPENRIERSRLGESTICRHARCLLLSYKDRTLCGSFALLLHLVEGINTTTLDCAASAPILPFPTPATEYCGIQHHKRATLAVSAARVARSPCSSKGTPGNLRLRVAKHSRGTDEAREE